MSKFAKHIVAAVSIAAVGVIAYLPAVDNSFISDDFGIFPFLTALEDQPSYIFEASSELFRVMSYVYFWALFKVFGASPEPYYWAGIALHALVSVLLYFLVLRLTGTWTAAWAAGLFFAAYERHQEAVMWISAANETVLTLNCVLFLLLWDRGVSREGGSRIASAAALIVFALALFSKEAAVVLAPMAVLILLRHGYSLREMIDKSIAIFALLAAYGVAWLSQADRNFFLTDGHYAPGLHAVSVYGRTLLRLLSPAIPSLAGLLLLQRTRRSLLQDSAFLFFAALLMMAIVPYSFLTYQDHVPSRHTYFPSLGLAAIVGISLATIYQAASSVRLRQAGMAALACLLIGNIAYVWLKKEPQFRERAAPTRELLNVLNSSAALRVGGPIEVCGFPLERPWWFEDAISRFTPLSPGEIVLRQDCANTTGAPTLSWDTPTARYVLGHGVEAPPTMAETVVRN